MPYNCIFHSSSKNPMAAKKVLDDFLKKTGFEAKEAPPNLEKMFDNIDALISRDSE